MSETEEERRLRKEKKREAARRAAEQEAKASAAAEGASATAETEEERRARKEKKRALREAAKRQEEEAVAAAVAPTAESRSKEEERAARRERKAKAAAAAEAEAAAAGSNGDGARTGSRPSLPQPHASPSSGEGAAQATAKRKKSVDDNAELLRAIEAENNAVAAAQSSARKSGHAVAPAAAPNTDGATSSPSTAAAAAAPESEEQRAARKQAEREERRRQRHAAKAAAAAAAADATPADGASNTEGGGGHAAPSPAASGRGTASPAGPSPTTAFDPSELQRQAYRTQFHKDLTRATALRRLVDFDSSGGVVVDLAPQTAYDLYIRDFGMSGREQAGVQAPPEEERRDTAAQAERGKTRSRGAQAPADLGLCPEEEAERQFFQLRRSAMQRSGRATDGGGGGGGGAVEGGEEEGGEESGRAGAKRAVRAVDAAVLERFLTSTLPLMSAVLDENNNNSKGAAAGAAEANGKAKNATAFSSGYTTFCWRGTRNRPLVQVMLHPNNPRQLLALHGQRDETGPSPVLDAYASVLLLWNVHNTTTPERVLVSFSAVTTVCVSPSRPHLLYGGTEDGNVCVWSLREPDRLHLAAGRFEKAVFHLPSYSSGWLADGHGAAVRQVRVLGYNAVSHSRKEEHEQLVSMDERGVVCHWVVTDRDGAGRAGGAAAAAAAGPHVHSTHIGDNEYGQHPFTSVSLHLAKNTSAAAAASEVEDTMDAAVRHAAGVSAGFDFSPMDAAQYVLTAPHGVVRRSRFGGLASPALYGPAAALHYAETLNAMKGAKKGAAGSDMTGTRGGAEAVSVVPCCVQYSVLDPRWFVAGYEDGTVRLFLQHEATPQLTVEVGYAPIIAVRCSESTPWVVWALDEGGEVHMIDLAHHNRQTPRLSQLLTQPDTGVCTCVDVSGKDERADQRVLAAGFEKGMVQLHTLDGDKLRIANAERDEKWI